MSPAERPSPARLVVAVVSIAGALATVAFHLGLFDGADAEVSASASEGPIPLASLDEVSDVDEVGHAADDADADAGVGAGPSPGPEAAAAEVSRPDGTPDWRGMFEALMAREEARAGDDDEGAVRDDELAEAAVETARAAAREADREDAARRAEAAAARIAGLVVRGIVAEAGAGVALVDGHLVRVGDLVPGTRASVVAIHRERIVVRHPDVAGPLDAHLAPFATSTQPADEPPADGAPAPEVVAAPPVAPEPSPDGP